MFFPFVLSYVSSLRLLGLQTLAGIVGENAPPTTRKRISEINSYYQMQ